MVRKAVLAVLIGFYAAPVGAQTDRPFLDGVMSRFLLDQLRCQQTPHPTPALTYVARTRAIRFKDHEDYGRSSCWKLSRPLNVAGLEVAGICASMDNTRVQAGALGHGVGKPDRSPGLSIAIATAASPAQTSAWVRENKLAPSDVRQSHVVRDGLDLSCSTFELGNFNDLPFTNSLPLLQDRQLRHMPQKGATEFG